MKVVNFGSCNIDCVYTLNSIVRPGETVSSLKLKQFPGGKGLNQSIAMARAGLCVSHAGLIGEDGLFLKNLLSESGVDTSLLKVTEEKTGHAIIQIDCSGENCIILYGGANQAITTEYVDEVLATMEKNDVLVLQNEISNLHYIIRKAKEKGIHIFLNPSPLGNLPNEINLKDFSGIMLNEIEAEAMFGTFDAEKLLEKITADTSNLLTVVTLGNKGCFCIANGKLYRSDAFKVQAVDTTAAGDTFTGFFISAYLKKADVLYAMHLATAAAALSVTVNGAASSIPKLEAAESFLKEKGLPIKK